MSLAYLLIARVSPLTSKQLGRRLARSRRISAAARRSPAADPWGSRGQGAGRIARAPRAHRRWGSRAARTCRDRVGGHSPRPWLTGARRACARFRSRGPLPQSHALSAHGHGPALGRGPWEAPPLLRRVAPTCAARFYYFRCFKRALVTKTVWPEVPSLVTRTVWP